MFSLEKLTRRSGISLFLPFYHAVNDGRHLHIDRLYEYPKVKQFENELEVILKHFKPIGADEIHNQHKKPVFHISFDDGFCDCFSIIAPILVKKGIPASFFINPKFIDNKALMFRAKASILLEFIACSFLNEALPEPLKSLGVRNDWKEGIHKLARDLSGRKLTWKDWRDLLLGFKSKEEEILDKLAEGLELDWGNYLQKVEPYLTSQELMSLADKGFNIGAHSFSHPYYFELSLKEQIKETQESLDWLSVFTGKHELDFAFPFTDNGMSRKGMEELHKLPSLRRSFGTAGVKKDEHPAHFQRFCMEGIGEKTESIIVSSFFKSWMKGFVGKQRVKR